MKLGKYGLILLLILFLGLLLRVFDLSGESLWLDEGYSIRVAHLEIPQTIKQIIIDVHPPLHFIMLHYWIDVFGDSEPSVRFLSVIFGMLALFMLYKIGALLSGKKTALLGTFLGSLSVFLIASSQEARMYSLVIFLALCSMYFFIKLFCRKNTKDTIGYVLCTALLFYTHHSAFFIILVQNIFIFTLLKPSKKQYAINIREWILYQIAIFILFLPWIAPTIIQLLRAAKNPAAIIAVPSPIIILTFLKFYAGSYLTLLCFLILCLYLLIHPKKEEKYPSVPFSYAHTNFLLFMWFGLPVLALFMLARIKVLFFVSRYVGFVSIPLFLLVARGIQNIRRKYLAVIIVFILTFISLLNLATYYARPNKNEWREVTHYIDQNAKAGDVILFHAGYFQKNVFDYYSKRKDLVKIAVPAVTIKVPITMEDKVIGVTNNDIKDMQRSIKGRDRVWIVLCHSQDRKNLIIKTLKKLSYNERLHKRYLGIEIYLYETKGK